MRYAKPADCHPWLSRRAFTLLEVILALAIMSVLAVTLFSSLSIAFKARDKAQAALEPVREIESVMEIIRGELESALPPRGTSPSTFVGTDYKGTNGYDDDDVVYATMQPGAIGRPKLGDIKRVQLITLLDQANGTRVLVRRVTSNLLSPNPQLLPDDEIICRAVRSFDIMYYDGTEWWQSWDSSLEQESLPIAVQVTLQLEPFGTSSVGPKISRIISLPCVGEADPTDKDEATGTDSADGATSEAGKT